MKNEKYPYQREWENYRFREKTLIIVFSISFPAILLFIFAGSSPADNYKAVAITLFLICLLLGIVSGFWLGFWKCPRCGHYFHFSFRGNNIFSAKCVRCQLPKYEGSAFESFFNEVKDNSK